MADNIAITAGSGTTVATDDIGGTHYQRVKLSLGADGTANDASAGAGAVGTGTQRVTLASDDPAVASLAALLAALAGTEYETVAASQTEQDLGATGATGDLLTAVTIIPATTSPGAVAIKDGAGTAITIFAGGADSVASLHPFTVPLMIRSGAGAWQITTGANVSVLAAGNFT